MKLEDFSINKEINLDEEIEEKAKNIKYKNSFFFMAIYNKIYEKEKNKLSEDLILQKSINNYKETLKRIILQKEIKEPFYKIKNINDIINVIKNQKNNINKEIIFIEKELSDLWNKNYIKNIISFKKKYFIY